MSFSKLIDEIKLLVELMKYYLLASLSLSEGKFKYTFCIIIWTNSYLQSRNKFLVGTFIGRSKIRNIPPRLFVVSWIVRLL